MSNVKKNHIEHSIRMGGQLGNYVIKLDHKIMGPVDTDGRLKKIQQEIFDLCDIGSEYFTMELLKEDNDHYLNNLDVNLERFVKDEDYYWFIFDHHRKVYDMIRNWFEGKITLYYKEMYDWKFGRLEDGERVELFQKVFLDSLDLYGIHWDVDDEDVTIDDVMEDLFKTFRKESVMGYDLENCCKRIEDRLSKNNQKWDGKMIDDHTMTKGKEDSKWRDDE